MWLCLCLSVLPVEAGTNGGYGHDHKCDFDTCDYEVFVISNTAGKAACLVTVGPAHVVMSNLPWKFDRREGTCVTQPLCFRPATRSLCGPKGTRFPTVDDDMSAEAKELGVA